MDRYDTMVYPISSRSPIPACFVFNPLIFVGLRTMAATEEKKHRGLVCFIFIGTVLGFNSFEGLRREVVARQVQDTESWEKNLWLKLSKSLRPTLSLSCSNTVSPPCLWAGVPLCFEEISL